MLTELPDADEESAIVVGPGPGGGAQPAAANEDGEVARIITFRRWAATAPREELVSALS